MRRIAAAVFAFLVPGFSLASTATPDYTDMWWNPDESGWGANVIQQGDTMFVTVFVYDAGRNSTWFVAPSVTWQGGGLFTGQLYQTTGTYYFQRPFVASSVATTTVGNLTFNAINPNRATLTYNVGGIVNQTNVTRQSWRTDKLAGFYLGGRQGTWSGCGALNGKVDSVATIGVSEQGDQVQIRDAGKGYTCNYQGLHRQAGHISEMTGNGVCDDGVTRFLAATEVQVSSIMFSMRYRMEQVGTDCVFEGYLGGIRQVQ
jgi:hypothetical protein